MAEAEEARGNSPPRTVRIPNKSYAWQVDQDFIAGDLQVSDSPRINTADLGDIAARRESNDVAFRQNQHFGFGHLGPASDENRPGSSGAHVTNSSRANTKPDEIPQREPRFQKEFPERTERDPVRPRNTKLDAIRQRGLEVEKVPLKNTKLDEIRQREQEVMSRKALAANQLDYIREQNSMSRSSLSSGPQPQRTKQAARESTWEVSRESEQQRPEQEDWRKVDEEEGERIPNTPITIFRQPGGDNNTRATVDPLNASDSTDILRRLARATSASSGPAPGPVQTKETVAEDVVKPATVPAEGLTTTHSRQNSADSRPSSGTDGQGADKTRLAAGFAGMRRVPSTDSTNSVKDKRSSRALSDNDPTDRIEAEMKLFAPVDHQSERGSVRAPSAGPPSDDDKEEDGPSEETPRPVRKDPSTMPTPIITGAYVETPAPAKVEDRRDEDREVAKPEPPLEGNLAQAELDTAKRNAAIAETERGALRRKIDDLMSQKEELTNNLSFQQDLVQSLLKMVEGHEQGEQRQKTEKLELERRLEEALTEKESTLRLRRDPPDVAQPVRPTPPRQGGGPERTAGGRVGRGDGDSGWSGAVLWISVTAIVTACSLLFSLGLVMVSKVAKE
jgi:hypothetical protein